jgi:uncharacterized protein
MMKRTSYLEFIQKSFRSHQVVALLGPRQVGKSTLARDYIAKDKRSVSFFDLEDPTDLAKLENPKLALQDLQGLVVIDEVQRRPDLFPILRVLSDKKKCKFLILGSASPELIKQSSESLAGRIAYIEIRPFTAIEDVDLKKLWLRGGFPKSYTAKAEKDSALWLKNYVSTFLERDIPQLGFKIPSQTLRKFWMMLAHYHGGILNAAEIGGALGVSGQSVRRYLDILTNTYMIRELQPWHVNIDKRQIKTPKIYFRDSGLFHNLLGLTKSSEIINHPKLGASWEGFALEQTTSYLNIPLADCFFWGTHSYAELDLFTIINGKKIGFEFKYTDMPKITKSISIATKELELDKVYIISPGDHFFKLNSTVLCVGLESLNKI